MPTTAAAVPDGALAGAPNDDRVGETPVASDWLNVRRSRQPINISGLNDHRLKAGGLYGRLKAA
jgi:hypothetical protein